MKYRAATVAESFESFLNSRKANGVVDKTLQTYRYHFSAMKITLDLDTNEIVVPKNFFKTIDKQNETIMKMGGQKISGLELIKKSFETAMADTDKYLHVREK